MKIILCLYFMCGILSAEENLFAEACQKYLTKFSTEEAELKWKKNLEEEYQQAVLDNEDNNWQRFFIAKTLDWAADNRNKFQYMDDAPVKDIIQMCRYVVLAKKKDLRFPKTVTEEFTVQNMLDVTQFLLNKADGK